jgi:hypothetical protein
VEGLRLEERQRGHLHVCIHNQLCKPENLTAQVESIPKARLLTLLGGQRLDGLEVEVVVQMQVIQILSVNQQVQHVVALPANLPSSKRNS